MTLGALHQRFLRHCAVEKRLRPMTIAAYRSNFGLFLEFLGPGLEPEAVAWPMKAEPSGQRRGPW